MLKDESGLEEELFRLMKDYQQPVSVAKPRYGLYGLVAAVLVAGGVFIGSRFYRPSPTSYLPQPSPTLELVAMEETPTPSPTIYVTPTSTRTPRPTPTYTPTTTPTITPTPTFTPTPLPLKGVGESYTAEDVAITLESYELKSKDPDCNFDTDIIFHMRYSNNTPEDILLRFNFADFQLHDNLGRQYKFTGTDKLIISLLPGGGCSGDFFQNVEVSHLVKARDSATWYLPFGESNSFDKSVEYVILTVHDFSRIPYAGWKIDIPD